MASRAGGLAVTRTSDWDWRADPVQSGVVAALETWLGRGGNLRTAVRQGVQTLLTENARLRAILGRCPRGLAVLDVHGDLIAFNRRFVEVIGATPELGKPLAELLEPSDREILDDVVRGALEEQRSAGVLKIGATAGGKRFEFFATTLPGGSGETLGVILAGDDESARDDSEEALADESTRSAFALAGSLLRTDFSEALHIAQQALATARELAVESRDEKLSVCSEALRQAEFALARCTAPPPDSLQVTQYANIADVVRRASRHALGSRGRRNVAIQLVGNSDLHVALTERQLGRILTNLLANAVHAVMDGQGVGIVRVEAEPADASRVIIRIRDDGVGIEPGQLANVFEPGVTSRRGAAGLGLAIVRLLVERADGDIRIASDPANGTVVELELPRHKGPAKSEA